MSDDLNSAINSAVTSAAEEAGVELTGDKSESAREVDVSPEPEPEPEPEPTTAKVTTKAKVEPEPDDDEEEFYNPTAEELALLEKSPELKKVYRSLRKGFTEKTTSLKQARKQLEERASVADMIQNDPEGVARAIAEARGYKLTKAEVTEAKNDVVDTLEKEWAEKVGPEAAKLLRPLISKTIESVIKQEIEPDRQRIQAVERAAQERGIAAAVRGFEAKIRAGGDEWDDQIQAEMAARIGRLEPGEGVGIDDYLQDIYDGVTASRMRLKAAKATRDRLRRLKDEQEPTTTVRPAPKSEERITPEMSEKDAIRLAVKQAREATSRR